MDKITLLEQVQSEYCGTAIELEIVIISTTSTSQ
jgi:hypothetical protein